MGWGTAGLTDGAVTSPKLAPPLSLTYASNSTPTIEGISDYNVGIKGNSTANTGVWGVGYTGVDGLSDAGPGVLGRSTSGLGVWGSTGKNVALYGVNNSTDHASVEGWNQGTGYIFKGWLGVPGSHSVKFFVANNGDTMVSGGLSSGAIAASSSTFDAVRGLSEAAPFSGVYGNNTNAGGYGVFGSNSAKGNSGYLGGVNGVEGSSANNVGVKGTSTNDTGVWGVGITGVDGLSDAGTGTRGKSTSGYGVWGITGKNIAVYGINSSIDTPAVEGWNQGTGDIIRGWSGPAGSQSLKFRVVNNGDMVISGTLSAAALATGMVTSSALASGSVSTSALANGAITAPKLANGVVGSVALAANAVTTTAIADAAISSAKLATGAVTSAKLASGAVGSAALAANAVTTSAITDGAVTSPKLASPVSLSYVGNLTPTIYGESNNYVGVKGKSSTYIGVEGYGNYGGVLGTGYSNYGVSGFSESGFGVTGEAIDNVAVNAKNESTSAATFEGWNLGAGDIIKGSSGSGQLKSVKFRVANNGDMTISGGLTSGAITATSPSGTVIQGTSTNGFAVWGSTGNNIAINAINNSIELPAFQGWNQGAGRIYEGWSGAPGVQTMKFSVANNGSLWAVAKNFRIDHPLDPKNKTLTHVSVESPDMKNIYDGVVVTDDLGYATVELPGWFEALNKDYRYQLTVIDETDSAAFVHAKVVKGVSGNSFTLRTSTPEVKVSWQVTGIRKDAWAEKNRIQVEMEKPEAEKGRCINPEACQ